MAIFDDTAKTAAQEAMGLSHERLNAHRLAAEHLARIRVSQEVAESYFRAVFKLDPASLQVRELADQAEAAAKRESRVMPKLRLDREKVLRDNWLGYRGETKRRALDLALQFVG